MKKTFFVPLLALVLAAGVLLGLSFGLQDKATELSQADHQALMEMLLPGSTEFVRQTGQLPEGILSAHKAAEGFVVEVSTQGYADEIRMLVGVTNAGTVTGLTVLDAHETWGLGGKILTDHEFLSQYLNTYDADSVDAITGATVTSKAVSRCVDTAVAYVTGADIESGATSWGG